MLHTQTKFKHLSKVVPKKKFLLYFYALLGFESRTLWPRAILDFGKGPLRNGTYQISAFSYVFLWFEPRITWPGTILDPGTLI